MNLNQFLDDHIDPLSINDNTITSCLTLTILALFDINANTITPGPTFSPFGIDGNKGKKIVFPYECVMSSFESFELTPPIFRLVFFFIYLSPFDINGRRDTSLLPMSMYSFYDEACKI
jgi:hypothetical protein